MNKKETNKLRRRYSSNFYSGNKMMFAITFLMMVTLSVCNLAVSYVMQLLIDYAAGTETAPIVRVAWLCLVIFLVFGAAYFVQRFTLASFIEKAMRQYKQYAFSEIVKKNISSFSGENTGKYISALTSDAQSIETNYLARVFTLVMEIVMFVGALAMMLWYSPVLTAVSIGLSLVPIVVSIVTGGRLAKREKQVSDRNEQFVSFVKDMLTGFSVIKSFKAEKQIQGIFADNSCSLEKDKAARRRTESSIKMAAAGAGLIAQMGVFLFGAYLAVRGSVTPGIVIVFVQLMNFVITPIGDVPEILASRRAAGALIDKLAAAASLNTSVGGKKVDSVLDSGIEFSDVSFEYDSGVPVLKGISKSFDAGKSYAVVGGSGSGKSTVLNLLMGSYRNYGGSISIDGDELRDIDPDSLYELISIVQQNVFVFDSTIKDNITMFKDFPQEQVSSAIERAGLEQLVADKGLDYRCGEGGSGLSGGEKQRISIARCLLRGTPVLLMDEATAALDTATARAVNDSILGIDGLTRIVVTHRLEENELRRYDSIVVMKSGKIVEQGDFDKLLNQRGQFYSLFSVAQA